MSANILIPVLGGLAVAVLTWMLSRYVYNDGYEDGWNAACQRFCKIRRRKSYEAQLEGEDVQDE